MSYCRMGTDSDVYALCVGESYEIRVFNHKVWTTTNETRVTTWSGTYHEVGTRLEFYDLLQKMRSDGVKVPDRAFTRLESEIATWEFCKQKRWGICTGIGCEDKFECWTN